MKRRPKKIQDTSRNGWLVVVSKVMLVLAIVLFAYALTSHFLDENFYKTVYFQVSFGSSYILYATYGVINRKIWVDDSEPVYQNENPILFWGTVIVVYAFGAFVFITGF